MKDRHLKTEIIKERDSANHQNYNYDNHRDIGMKKYQDICTVDLENN